MVKKIIVLLCFLVLIAGVIYIFGQLSSEQADESKTDTVDKTEIVQIKCEQTLEQRLLTIDALRQEWDLIQAEISQRPVQGSTGQNWQEPTRYQFISKDRILIAFEDGHVMLMATLEYLCAEGGAENFTLVTQAQEFPFMSDADWEEHIGNYGDTDYPIHNYIIQENTITETQENLFVF